MKMRRQNKILEIIESREIETQEELIDALQREGFHVTQATISRDIREMKLQKIMTDHGQYKYIVQKPHGDAEGQFAYSKTLAASIVSVDYAMNLVVVKTYPGMAQAVAAGLDAMPLPSVLGCVAGDDTLFLAIRDLSAAAQVAADIRKMAGK